MFSSKRLSRLSLILLGAATTSFGIYNIHARCGIAEGGSVGLALLTYQ
ncbi:MAG: hypothetical protein LLG09_04275 [Negativicutes bacterium]|nr:hypothetical protein [Negativicutes bacterium]